MVLNILDGRVIAQLVQRMFHVLFGGAHNVSS
jgi:hypothetical protein